MKYHMKHDMKYPDMQTLKRNDTNELTYKRERDSQTQRTNLWLSVHTTIFKMNNQQEPTVQPMELCSMLCGSLEGRGVWGELIYIYTHISVQFSHSVVSDSLRPHELQHPRSPCPSPTSRVHSNLPSKIRKKTKRSTLTTSI